MPTAILTILLFATGHGHRTAIFCPVTHLPISSPKAAVGKSVYKGKTYYFCTKNCKRLFDKNPAKYVHSKR